MKILLLAQTPPPVHGQSVMLQYLVNAKWDWCEKDFIRLDFAESAEAIGKFKIKKIFKLIRIITKVWANKLKGRIDILFYPPASPNRIPFYRDVFILLLVRWCSKKIIFQFHAGGFDILYSKLNRLEKFLAAKIYNKPDAAIVLSENLKKEIKWIKPKKTFVVPNGVEDHFPLEKKTFNNTKINILTVGILSKSKGILVSIEAVKILRDKKYNFEWNFLGDWESEDFKNEVGNLISKYKINEQIKFQGVVEGKTKWEFFNKANIFCLPTFENEAMPLVILEAMMMSLPVVSTKWRTIPNIIDDEANGFLIPIKDSNSLSAALEKLILKKDLRDAFGKNAREKYLKEFTLGKHLKNMENVFKEVTY